MSFSVNIAPLERTLSQLKTNVAELQTTIPTEFEVWQADDMNRRFPHVIQRGDDEWYTLIRPRSISPRSTKFRAAPPKPKKISKRKYMFPGTGGGRTVYVRAKPSKKKRPASTRPILRPILFDMLRVRMRAVLDQVPPWQ